MLVIYLLAGVVCLVILAMVIGSHHPMFKMTSATTGTVVSATVHEIPTRAGGTRAQTEVVAAYTAGGEAHHVSHVLPGRHADRFPQGMKLRVKYDPAHPRTAALAIR